MHRFLVAFCGILLLFFGSIISKEEQMISIAINGFGRIGRTFLRTILLDEYARNNISVVVINLGPSYNEKYIDQYLADAFKYDTIMGTYPGEVSIKDGALYVDDVMIQLCAEGDFDLLPWNDYDLDWVVDCSGKVTKREIAKKHLMCGAKHVLISAPAHDPDVIIIPGVNDDDYIVDSHKIVSLGSCTTNALLPMLKVINDSLIIESGFMTTVHAYTNTQVLIDSNNKDPRRCRAAALNIIPTNTGAARMIGKVIPELDGKVKGMALRVPVANVSLIDLVLKVKTLATKYELQELFISAAQGELSGIIGVTNKKLVSSDFMQSSYSVTIDQSLIDVSGSSIKLLGWYDNEWGYSCRLRDFLLQQV
jgi:glyceraldehyde 3-phosphate dehydrogenase